MRFMGPVYTSLYVGRGRHFIALLTSAVLDETKDSFITLCEPDYTVKSTLTYMSPTTPLEKQMPKFMRNVLPANAA